MVAGKTGNVLGVSVYNAGSVPITITAVSVTSSTGAALSQSPASGSEYLTGGADLNVSLPITLAQGEGTSYLSGYACSTTTVTASVIGCNIGIYSSALTTNGQNDIKKGVTVFVNILTQRGNSFKTPYPPVVYSTTTTSSLSTVLSTSYVYSITSTSTATTLASVISSTTIGGFEAGTNSVLLTMQACEAKGNILNGSAFTTKCSGTQPLAVYTGQEILLLMTVTDNAIMNGAVVPMSVVVNFQDVLSSQAQITLNATSIPSSPPCTSTGTNLWATGSQVLGPSNPTEVFACTFAAEQPPTGVSGGTVTFLGFAVGQYPPPPTTQTGEVTSAEVSSNTLDIGNPLASISGPFVPVSFQFSNSTVTSFQSAAEIPGTSSDVAWVATVYYTGSISATILQYSFVLTARVAQEQDFFLTQPLKAGATSLSGYNCAPATTSPYTPAGSQCATAQENCPLPEDGCVPTGTNATLYFAASAVSGTSWKWGSSTYCSADSGTCDPPEAMTMFVIIIYSYYSGGVWNTAAQAIPFSGTWFNKS